MNTQLRALSTEIGLNNPDQETLRWQFCIYCASTIHHLLEQQEAIYACNEFLTYTKEVLNKDRLVSLQQYIQKIANQHPGSTSIDGTKHSAVSATYALANAIAGNAIAAAEYAAYAIIYGYGGYAVNDLTNYREVYEAQVNKLKNLISMEQNRKIIY